MERTNIVHGNFGAISPEIMRSTIEACVQFLQTNGMNATQSNASSLPGGQTISPGGNSSMPNGMPFTMDSQSVNVTQSNTSGFPGGQTISTGGNCTMPYGMQLTMDSQNYMRNVPQYNSGRATNPVGRSSSSQFATNRGVEISNIESRSNGNRLMGHSSMRALRNRIDSSRNNAFRRQPVQLIIQKPLECICLGCPSDVTTPDIFYLRELNKQNLGNTVMYFESNASAEQMEHKIRSAFTQLTSVEFTVMKAAHGGGVRRGLIEVDSRNRIPDMASILLMKLKKIYVVPSRKIFVEEDEDVSDNMIVMDLSGDISGDESFNAAVIEVNVAHHESSVNTANSLPLQILGMQPSAETVAKWRSFREVLIVQGSQRVDVKREELLSSSFQCLKEHEFDPFKIPYVSYEGEIGIDLGGPRREWLYDLEKLILHSQFNNHVLFDGPRNHKLPAGDAVMLRLGVFPAIGKFVLLNCIHGRLGMRGLGRSAVNYFISDDSDDLILNYLDESDLSDEAKSALDTLKSIKDRKETSQEERDELTHLASVAGCFLARGITPDNAEETKNILTQYDIIEKRRRQLDSIKRVLEKSGLSEFLRKNPDCLPLAFPEDDFFLIQVDSLIAKIRVSTTDVNNNEVATNVNDWMKEFIEIHREDADILRKLLRVWTGSGDMPEDNVYLEVTPGSRFLFHTCSSELEVPMILSKQQFNDMLTESLLKTTGFEFI
ncbi:unnamed protein product [Allacma fusca]|uniref:HECT domain-containing protein n=1 Tax=Allacma fusca TaxID=39272 RepID=A0A8J2Q0V1_9HEXA|nr:unnamed protein product [Allacma fusca]